MVSIIAKTLGTDSFGNLVFAYLVRTTLLCLFVVVLSDSAVRRLSFYCQPTLL